MKSRLPQPAPLESRIAAQLLLATLIAVLARPSFGQTDSVRSRPCWRGKPAPACTSFWITEVALDAIVAGTGEHSEVSDGQGGVRTISVRHFPSPNVVWTVGPMFNTAPLRALGGTLSIGPVPNGMRLAAELRRRWWTPEGSSLDLSIGTVARDVPHAAPLHAEGEYGLTASAFLVGGDVMHVYSRVDYLMGGTGKPIVGASVGIGLGSRPAVYGSILAALLAHALIGSSSGGT